ncbi:MAG TPA: hypothetical protein VGN78_14015 [Solirubrobacteraceae bacterium]|nr:hypothetical protein [Solirubrobacteraceae bacterium]
MKPNDPPPQTSGDPSGQPPEGGAGGSEPGDDPLDTLRDRLRSTQDAVERLADEAANAAREASAAGPEGPPGEGNPGRPPRNGYAVPGGGATDQSTRELQALVGLLDVVRGLIPRELADQLTDLVRELLLLVRALIDWYLERLELRRRPQVEVEDIPIS